MRRGQTTLEYVLLIGVIAAGLIAMIVYVSRGHQGNLRSQADQLGARQYEPGNTRMDKPNNWETKRLTKNEKSASSTTTKHSAYPIGEINKPLQGDPGAEEGTPEAGGLIGQIGTAWGEIYKVIDQWELQAGNPTPPPSPEGLREANDVRQGEWPWVPPTDGIQHLEDVDLADKLKALSDLKAEAKASSDGWHDREPDVSLSGTSSTENGTTTTHKEINETLGDLR